MSTPAPATVIYLIENLGPGGIETVLWELLRHIPRERYRILPWFLAETGPSFERMRAAFPETRFLGLRTYHLPGPLWRLARELRRTQPDILHLHGYFAGAFGRLVAPWLRLPWVYSLYSHYEDTYQWRHYLMERWLARSRGMVVACSEIVRTFGIERCRIPPAKIVVNYEGTDVPPQSAWPARDAARASFGLPRDAFVVGTVCRLYPGKNVQLLVRAVQGLPETCHVLIAGDGPELATLQQLAAALRLTHRVHFAGLVTDVARAYMALDLFAQTSHVREGWSVALVEAMAFARAVVATRIGANLEAVTPAVGWLVPHDDPAPLRECIAHAMADREALARAGAAARERYLQAFTGQHMARGFAAVYARLVSGAP